MISHNPPATPDPVPSTPPTTVATAHPSMVPTMTHNPPPTQRLEDYPKLVNPKDKDGRAIFLSGGTNCYVELPFGPLKPNEQRPPGTPPPHKTVTCPKELSGPAWEACQGGTIHSKDDGKSCVCFRMGNPPYPPNLTTCP